MSIYRITRNIPTATKLKQLNDMIVELNGYYNQGKFNKNELDQLFDSFPASRKFAREVGLGNTVATYVNWSHLNEETGYSIWKYTPTSYDYNTLNQLYFDGAMLENRGNATSESATAFAHVFLYNAEAVSGGTSYVTNTTEAGTENGTEFPLMNSADDLLYLGDTLKFGGAKFEFQTRGSNYNLVVEYWNGAWTAMTEDDNNLDESTNNFQGDGHINWSIPSDWSEATINGETKYWIRISTTTGPVTEADAYLIIPYTSVIGLLAMHSTEVMNEAWAWCSYGSNIYVTVKNAGNTNYEGDYFITSASSSTNKENYFVHNHQYTLDHELSTFNPCQEITTNSSVVDTDAILLVDTSAGDVTLTLPAAHTREGMEFIFKKIDSSSNDVIVATESGELIDGGATKSITTQYNFMKVVSDNANWHVIGGAAE